MSNNKEFQECLKEVKKLQTRKEILIKELKEIDILEKEILLMLANENMYKLVKED